MKTLGRTIGILIAFTLVVGVILVGSSVVLGYPWDIDVPYISDVFDRGQTVASGSGDEQEDPTATADVDKEAEATAEPTSEPTEEPTPEPTATTNVASSPTESLTADAVDRMGMLGRVDSGDAEMVQGQVGNGMASFQVFGAPAQVDSDQVLRANGEDEHGNVFENSLGLGSSMILAEPGSILYGPDEDSSVVEGNPHGDWISPITQQMLGTETFDVNTAEGAFTWVTSAALDAEFEHGGIGVRLDGEPDHNWFLITRGLFPGEGDRNTTTHLSGYKPGHAQVMWYPSGAYISEGNFLQVSELSHTGGRNCGDSGCQGLSVLMLDLNTGAWLALHQPTLNASWELLGSNWYQQ